GVDVADDDIEAMAASIHRDTGGIPLFVVDAIRANDATDDGRPWVPSTARTLVGRRLSLAGPDATTVAEACAVLGDPFRAREVISLVPELAPGAVVAALDRLASVGLLVEHDGLHRFEHAVFRNAVAAGLASGRRATLHAAAYRTLRSGDDAPALLAHHAERGEPLVHPSEVSALLQGAADDAAGRGAFSDAAAFFERLLSRASTDERAGALARRADVLWRSGDIGAAKRASAELVAEAKLRSLPDDAVAEAVVVHTRFGDGFYVDPESIALVDDALALVQDPASVARIHAASAYHHAAWGSPLPVALAAIERAVDVLPVDASPVLLGEVVHAESLARMGSPDIDRRAELAREQVRIGRRSSSWRDFGNGLRSQCLVEMSLGRFDALATSLDELLVVAERSGLWLYRTDHWRWKAAVSIAQGDEVAVSAAIAELERLGATPWAGRAFVEAQRALLAWSLGRMDECIAVLDALVVALGAAPRSAPDRRLIELVRLCVLADDGRDDEVRAALGEWSPFTDLDQVSCRHVVADLVLLARLACCVGDREAGADVRTRLAPFAGQLAVISWGEGLLGAVDRYLAELGALVDSEVDEALFDRAIALESAASAHAELARTHAARDRVRAMAHARV
ncbi:MAG TPA: hypothetical protein VEA78_08195, partial [Acidimicrobiales bacterium]|nr:hypothetical protein [Acidimicrobiales bacterium]